MTNDSTLPAMSTGMLVAAIEDLGNATTWLGFGTRDREIPPVLTEDLMDGVIVALNNLISLTAGLPAGMQKWLEQHDNSVPEYTGADIEETPELHVAELSRRLALAGRALTEARAALSGENLAGATP